MSAWAQAKAYRPFFIVAAAPANLRVICSHDGWLCWLPCRSTPDRVCRADFDHSRCVMDTCGLERVERFLINLNEKNFASQKNTLTSSLPQRCRAVGTYGSGNDNACQCIPRPCCCEKGMEFGWHWPEPTQACLSGTRQKEHPS